MNFAFEGPRLKRMKKTLHCRPHWDEGGKIFTYEEETSFTMTNKKPERKRILVAREEVSKK